MMFQCNTLPLHKYADPTELSIGGKIISNIFKQGFATLFPFFLLTLPPYNTHLWKQFFLQQQAQVSCYSPLNDAVAAWRWALGTAHTHPLGDSLVGFGLAAAINQSCLTASTSRNLEPCAQAPAHLSNHRLAL